MQDRSKIATHEILSDEAIREQEDKGRRLEKDCEGFRNLIGHGLFLGRFYASGSMTRGA